MRADVYSSSLFASLPLSFVDSPKDDQFVEKIKNANEYYFCEKKKRKRKKE